MRMFELMDRLPSINLEGGQKLSTVNQGTVVIDHKFNFSLFLIILYLSLF